MSTIATTTVGFRAQSDSRAVGVWTTAAGLTIFCAFLCVLRWVKLDAFWGDSPRWIFEAYRTASGEFPYRDFTWQYPPLANLLFGGALAIFGAKFIVIQALLDVLSTCLILLTWDTARRFVPDALAIAASIVLACAGVGNSANFALFSLQLYTPAILLGTVGLLLVIRAEVDYLNHGALSYGQIAWLIVGATAGLLSKPEFMLAIPACLAATAWLDLRLWFRFAPRIAWARRHVGIALLATAPALVCYAAIFAIGGSRQVLAGMGGYGTAALTCPWWPTGLGLFGALVAIGYGVIAAAATTLLRARHSWTWHRKSSVALWAGAAVSLLLAAGYLPYCVAELPVFSGTASPVKLVSYFLSTGTILLPVMWIGISLWLAVLAGFQRKEFGILMLLLTPAVFISLRGLFGGTMSQLTQVSMAAYPIWVIVGACLMFWFLQKSEITRRPVVALSATMLAYAAIRLAGATTAEAGSHYTTLETDAGNVRIRDTGTASQVYSYVATHSIAGEPILDVADGGGVNFGAHRSSPIFSTQFTAFAPVPAHLATDLTQIEAHPPHLVIANSGQDFQAAYGLCLNTGCSFPKLVWRSTTLACDPTKTFPVLEYIRSHYKQVAQFGEKVIYARNALP